jgi:transcription elongation GreA/GreB family factor
VVDRLARTKQALKAELLELLEGTLAAARQAHRSAVEGATHGEARPENDKDTRGLEQSYLARGQALRIEALEGALAQVRAMPVARAGAEGRVAQGSLVIAHEGELPRRYYLAPDGGGLTLAHGAWQVVTPRSPLGQALLGKRAEDECELVLGGKRRTLVVASVE